MKKKIIFGMVSVMTVLALVGCGLTGNKNTTNEGGQSVGATSADAVLNKAFDRYEADDKFPLMGGDAEHAVDGKAGIYSLTDVEGLQATIHIAEEQIAQIDEAATAVHAMNANNFTAGALHLKDANNAKDFVAKLKDSILATQWICGFPEELEIYTVDDVYVVLAFGAEDLVDDFTDELEDAYGKAAARLVEHEFM